MRIAIGSDHHGLDRKGTLIAALEASGHMVLDLGASSTEPVDYPDYARVVGQAVLRDFVEAGVLVCGSGVGAAIAANKIRGVRAAPCADAAAALESRQQLDANVLCLSAHALDDGAAIEVTLTWIGAKFSGDEAHARQVAKLAQLEAGPVQERAAPRPAPSPPEPRRAAESPPRRQPPSRRCPPQPASPAAISTAASTPPAEAVAPAASLEPAPATVPAAPAPLPLTRDALEHPVTEETLAFLESHDFLDRFWVKDASLWRGDAEAVRNRLGWLTSPAVMRGHVEELRTFADEIRRLQFSHVVVLGTGGSSRAARAVCGVFGSKMGFPDLFVLDSPDPAAVKHMLDSVTLGRTLVVVSSKSGTTAGDPRALRVLPRAGRDLGAEVGSAVRRHHRPGHAARGAGGRDGLPADLPERPVHRRPLLGAELLRPRPRRPHGRRHQGPGRAEPGHGRALR